MLNYYLLTYNLTYEIKPEDVYEKFLSTNIYLNLAISQKTLSFMIIKMKQSLAK